MSRSSFALLALLVSLAGPLLFAPRAKGEESVLPCPPEAYQRQSICTPPAFPVHPTDRTDATPSLDGLDTAVDEAEDWRDFMVESPGKAPPNQYDDLFETLQDAAVSAAETMNSSIMEAAARYQAKSATAAASASPEPCDLSGVGAYESEFSGFQTTDYLRDNFDYKAFTGAVLPANDGLALVAVVKTLVEDGLTSDLAADVSQMASEMHFASRQIANRYSFEALVDASELAWDRLEEYHRQTAPRIEMVSAQEEVGFRLADDDCGWECWHVMRAQELASRKQANEPQLGRAFARSMALQLKELAAHLDTASGWIAQMGGVDVADLQPSSSTSR